MKVTRFVDPAGSIRTGEWTDDGIAFGGRSYDHDEVDVLPPVEPSKIVCIGRNYAPHADERNADIPDRPLLFLKPPNALSGHGDTVTLPSDRGRIEYEAEVGVVIGEQCRNVQPEDAADVIAGYTCVNDLSNREDQRQEQNWVRGKAFDNAAPMGPVMATPDEVPEHPEVTLHHDGEVKQNATTADLIFPIPDLIAEITTLMTLEPGDVIATGTPAGVGPLSDGDVVEVEVEGVGTLRTHVRFD
ncbi:fumarylacetoacetate hydrolase family protein [Haloplanus pelagicus]|jgi:2-keto-4-pentenoate hydratase/2-oxohepta-3-ene-1,7-dioic acid hydratase in catechol pathway|uniref:fumarylacetoacetate hydrolase family protein n=1 Tax=Haloplanus pelagicus TaxID=2949995 RepID=UPI00203D0D11|nr:fumarylacetoacetate hydrolase family protein [Haloplanus sp. HW8-1]